MHGNLDDEDSSASSLRKLKVQSGVKILKKKDKMAVEKCSDDDDSSDIDDINLNCLLQFFNADCVDSFLRSVEQDAKDQQKLALKDKHKMPSKNKKVHAFEDVKPKKPKSLLLTTNKTVEVQHEAVCQTTAKNFQKITEEKYNSLSGILEQIMQNDPVSQLSIEYLNGEICNLTCLSNSSKTNQAEETNKEHYRGTAKTILGRAKKPIEQQVKDEKQLPKALYKMHKSNTRYFE